MVRRTRYDENNPAPIRVQRKDNGATDKEPRYTSTETARALDIPKRTLTRWYARARFPEHPKFTEAYEPEEHWVGNQMRLMWPKCVVDRIRSLLADTSNASGLPGIRRLPEVPWKTDWRKNNGRPPLNDTET